MYFFKKSYAIEYVSLAHGSYGLELSAALENEAQELSAYNSELGNLERVKTLALTLA
jgi:hypothetical protein